MRIDAYQIFASGCSENRLVGALEVNIHQVISLDVLLSTSSKNSDLEIRFCFRSALNRSKNSYGKGANETHREICKEAPRKRIKLGSSDRNPGPETCSGIIMKLWVHVSILSPPEITLC